ncbi:hypothetical protein MTR_0044s0150 [Medicago truncatula]|uniref:Uncharacterized protein n=1 Tax=Medicago truncatula TaxID=3880 RepID=G7ZUQ2_MEDTR|nr:hypothetical protein MTR_0044s0150 [Medicago truncatula]
MDSGSSSTHSVPHFIDQLREEYLCAVRNLFVIAQKIRSGSFVQKQLFRSSCSEALFRSSSEALFRSSSEALFRSSSEAVSDSKVLCELERELREKKVMMNL